MAIINEKFLISTKGFCDIIDITRKVKDIARAHNLKNALVNIYTPSSTASIITLEYEPGLVQDLPSVLEDLIPIDKEYEHDKKWKDNNAAAHIRASILGASISIPLANYELELGSWQKIVLIDFDNKLNTRAVIVQFIY